VPTNLKRQFETRNLKENALKKVTNDVAVVLGMVGLAMGQNQVGEVALGSM
jgi:hypothetical protein